MGVGTTEILIVCGVFVLLFGSTQLPKLARSIGQSIVELRKGISGEEETND
jgi:sec-independent protein translocase protein TatA